MKDPTTGHFTTRHDEYLEVKWRLVWFREKYPHGSIITEEMVVDLDRGYARFKTTVGDGEGGIATGTWTETRKNFEDFVEKAETRSVGRALAALGIGTQFVDIQPIEIDHILAHHDLAKARTILWKARRNTPAPTGVAVAN